MARVTWGRAAFGILLATAGASVAVTAQQAAPTQQVAPDLILTGGKIITVDERFSIAQAVAVRGDRITAVGTNQQITAMAGPATRRIDLQGRSVTPGFIDNHAHFMEEGAYWQLENRLDGVDSRKAAVETIRARAKTIGPGPDKWVFTLGGWSPDQFADDRKPFTKAELDAAAPNNPVLLQFTRCCTYLNSKAIEALGLETMTEPWIERDSSGRTTGVVGQAGAGRVSKHLLNVPKEIFESSSMLMLRDLNEAGLTSSGGGCQFRDIYRRWANEGRAKMRFFCLKTAGGASTPEQADKLIAAIPTYKLFQGDHWIDDVYWGERIYNLDDNMTAVRSNSPPEAFAQWGRIARELAKHGIPIFIHTTLENTVEGQLQQVEAINKEFPIRHLRWAFKHMEQVTPGQIERMRAMGMGIGVHPRATIMGAIFNRVHGERSFHEPPLRTIQDSGIQWGFGTDAFEVNQFRPFTTLYWAVTGKMVGGLVVNREPIGREDALIAHTRKNAYFIFRENDLGSIQPGKLADMVVLNRDYLTVPADEIKDIKSVMTIVGGKTVFEAPAR
jgi:predicted amidohydrolase YtcJ